MGEDYQSIKNNDAYPDYYAHNDGNEDYQSKNNKNGKSNGKGKGKNKNKTKTKNKNKNNPPDIGSSKAANTFDPRCSGTGKAYCCDKIPGGQLVCGCYC